MSDIISAAEIIRSKRKNRRAHRSPVNLYSEVLSPEDSR